MIYLIKYVFKTEDLNLSMFNIIKGINELNILTKHISCECKCRSDERKCNSNVDVSVKSIMYVKKIILGILLHAIMKMENI